MSLSNNVIKNTDEKLTHNSELKKKKLTYKFIWQLVIHI